MFSICARANNTQIHGNLFQNIDKQDPEITLQKVTEECQRFINVKRDNTCNEEKYRASTKDKTTKSPQK